MFIWNKPKQFILTALFFFFFLHLRDRLKYISNTAIIIQVQMIQWYIFLLKIYYLLYNTLSMLYMGNVLPGWERYRWNVSSVQRRSEWELQHTERFHAHVLVYKASVQKLLHLRHWAIDRNVTQWPIMLTEAIRSIGLQALQRRVSTFWIQ